MPNREQIRRVIAILQVSAFGWCYPSVLMQYALGDLEQLNLNIEHLQKKRDWIVKALRDMGYKLRTPDGTFFLLVRSPWQDDCSFAELLQVIIYLFYQELHRKSLVTSAFPSLKSEDMLSRSLAKFQAAIEYAVANSH
ncbi:MAG: hypothetical protein PUP92_07325 [Rhizonema sp. PD38]|nr:hypothetical protein [Rhizonema sp. PD38]